MRKHGANSHSKLRGRWLSLKGHLFLLALLLACPLMAWSQERGGFAPVIKVLAALESYVYDWSPDGKRLAYVTDDGIWVVEAPDFSQPRHLIRKERGGGGSSPLLQVLWSPDGQKLAFMDSRPSDGWDTIWVADADGSHVRDLLPPGVPFPPRVPFSSHPGVTAVKISTWLNNREIVFAQRYGTGCLDFNKIDVESSTYWHLCAADVWGWGDYYWAPTKDRAIIFMRDTSLGLVDGRNSKRISSHASYSREECRSVLQMCTGDSQGGEWWQFNGWSPDGKQILYTGRPCSKELGTVPFNLYLWEADSSRQEKLLPNAGWAAWSPDGSQIAFILWGEPYYDQSKRIIGTGFTVNRPFRVFLGVMEVATKAVHTLVPLGPQPIDLEKGVHWSPPLWSPDSKQLAVWDVQGDLFLIRADGSGRRPITQGMEVNTVSWSPDGKRLALRQESPPLYIVELQESVE